MRALVTVYIKLGYSTMISDKNHADKTLIINLRSKTITDNVEFYCIYIFIIICNVNIISLDLSFI